MLRGAGARLAALLSPHRFACAVLGAAASLPIPSLLSIDRPPPSMLPHPWAASGASLIERKERSPEAASEDAAPPGAIPTLATLVNPHTGELLPLSETEPTPARFSEFLEDRGLQSRLDINPALIEMLRGIARSRPGLRIEIVSGYRSPKRNEMMRKKGRNVASHSQHTLGNAIDFRIDGMRVGEVVKALDDLKWQGGIGRYDGRGDLFVHADVGPKRRWRGR